MCDEALAHGNATMRGSVPMRGNATMSYNVSMHGDATMRDGMPT